MAPPRPLPRRGIGEEALKTDWAQVVLVERYTVKNWLNIAFFLSARGNLPLPQSVLGGWSGYPYDEVLAQMIADGWGLGINTYPSSTPPGGEPR